MVPSPTPEPSNRFRRFITHRITLTIAALVGVALAGGSLWAWFWIRERLVPLIESNLEQLLGRPIRVGAVRQVSLTGVSFGESALPATPTDPDRATAEAVEVGFSPLQLVFNRTLQLEVTLVEPDAYIEQAKDGSWLSTRIKTQEGGGFLKTDLQAIRVRNGSVVLQPYTPGKPDPLIAFNQLNGSARFLDNNQRIRFEVSGQAVDGGPVRLAGVTRPSAQQTTLMLEGQNLEVTDIGRLVELPIELRAGRADGDLTIELAPEQPPEITGTATLRNVTAALEALPQPFSNTQGRLQFRGNIIAFEGVRTRFGTVPAQVQGTINLEQGYNLAARIPATSAKNVLDSLNLDAPVPVTGNLRGVLQVLGPLQQPVVRGAVETLRTAQIDRVPFRSIQGQFQLTTAGTPRITLAGLRAIPQAGGVITGGGQVRLGDQPNFTLRFQANQVPGDTIARLYGTAPGITIGEVSAIARVAGTPNNLQTLVQFRAPEATYPGRGELAIVGQQVRLRNGLFNVAGGTVRAQGQLVNGQFRATVDASQVALNPFSPDLRGQLSGTVQLTGNTDALNLANIQAAGQVRFSQGIAVVEEPLTAQFRWNGSQVIVEQATAPGLFARGTVAVQTAGNTPQIDRLNLVVQAQGYELQDFNLNLPENLALVGQANFAGQITGTPSAPNARGALQLRNLRVNGLAFDPLLAGRVNFQSGRQTDLALAGQRITGTQDRIALTLDPNNRPTSFLVKRDQAIARGQSQGDTLLVNLQEIPVALLQNLLPGAVANLGPIAGDLSGTLTVNPTTLAAQGIVAIANPRVAGLTGDIFRGRVSFADGVARLTEGELIQGDSRISLGGGIQLGGTRPVDFRITFDETRIQSLLQALNSLPLGNVLPGAQPAPFPAAVATLDLPPIDLTDEPLVTQLRRLAEIQALLAQQEAAQEEVAPLPELTALEGRLNGALAVTGSLQGGLNINFDLRGNNLEWGNYDLGTAIAQGQFANGTLTLQPLRINTEAGFLTFSGQFGQRALTGQLVANDLSLNLLQPFLARLPVDVDGNLDAAIDLSGSLNNPSAAGQLGLENATIRNQPIQQAQLEFRYADARLDFESTVLVTGTSPVVATGSVPIALPFATVQPASDQLRVRAAVTNEGLSLINLFTDQLTWVDGQGELSVVATGTLNQPVIQGGLVVQNATLETQVLSDPLTNVTGRVVFNRDSLVVQTLQAQYNQQPITAQGVLPVSNPNLVAETPLTAAFEDLTLNLQELYQGDVSGNVVIRGAALAPTIGGRLRLADGQVRLGEVAERREDDEPGNATITPTPENLSLLSTVPATDLNESPAPVPIGFNNLQVILGDDVRVTFQPILDFTTEGAITVNGSLRDLRPQGIIRLTQGQISLFQTEFRLERGYEQTVRFTPEGGIDPIVDVRLIALVPEATGFRLPTDPDATEILDPIVGNELDATGTLRTIEVTARVEGPVSELEENLELTSSPNRSRAEIIALIGGGFINNLGQGDPLLGAANLAGNAFFRRFQGTITDLGQAIGLSDLRVYSTLVNEPSTDATVLGLAAEAVVDITGNFSVSASRVFAAEDPFRFNVLYRLNDQILLRGSTDLEGDSRAEIQYETRF